jgi:hypothetical protein
MAPGDDGSAGTELASSGYGRQAITFGTPGPATGNAQQVANTNNVQFGPDVGADWLPAVAFGIFDAPTGGNLLYWNTLTAPKTILIIDKLHCDLTHRKRTVRKLGT